MQSHEGPISDRQRGRENITRFPDKHSPQVKYGFTPPFKFRNDKTQRTSTIGQGSSNSLKLITDLLLLCLCLLHALSTSPPVARIPLETQNNCLICIEEKNNLRKWVKKRKVPCHVALDDHKSWKCIFLISPEQLLRLRWENDHQFFKSIIFGQTGKIYRKFAISIGKKLAPVSKFPNDINRFWLLFKLVKVALILKPNEKNLATLFSQGRGSGGDHPKVIFARSIFQKCNQKVDIKTCYKLQ